MKKIIKKIGNSLGIIFNKEEVKILKLKKGNIFEFDVIENNKKKRIKND